MTSEEMAKHSAQPGENQLAGSNGKQPEPIATPERTEVTPVRILLVEDNQDFARLVDLFLRKYKPGQFDVVWKESGRAALAELDSGSEFDIILMDYFLPGQNGVEITRALQEKKIATPVVFLTVNKDFELAVEVMKLGVEDYLVKEEISTPVLPKTILNVIERQKLRNQLTALEVTAKRLEAIQELVHTITQEIRLPLDSVQKVVHDLIKKHPSDNLSTYLTLIRDNLQRIEKKIVKLKGLKSDKTVQYVKDIRMFDLS